MNYPLGMVLDVLILPTAMRFMRIANVEGFITMRDLLRRGEMPAIVAVGAFSIWVAGVQ
jgi:methylthioribose-1-phosphate isomerase